MDTPSNQFEYVGFWTRVLAALIDALLGICLIPIQLQLSRWGLEHRTILPELAMAVLWTGLYIWCVMRFGGTPGKLLLGIRIVDVRGNYLNLARAFRRELFPHILYNAIFMLQIYQAYRTYPESAPQDGFIARATISAEYGEPFASIMMYLGLLVYLDIGVVLFNSKKRAIHDFIAGSYVITKQSYINQAPAMEELEMGAPGLDPHEAEA